MGDTCRLCPDPATAVDVFVLDHNDARVEHATCAAHRAGLREEMLAAGWKQLPPDDAYHLADEGQRRWSLSVITASGDEVRISLHPISLARLVAESIEDATEAWCRRKGHVESGDEQGYCVRCGRSLPDDGSPYGSWMYDAYRTIRKVGGGRG